MTKASVQKRSVEAASKKATKKSNYVVDPDDLEPLSPFFHPFRNCICDLVDDSDTGHSEQGQKIKSNPVLVDGAPCKTHDLCCQECHYELGEIERYERAKQDCICELLLYEKNYVPESEHERRKRHITPFLPDGEPCFHSICCRGCHYELLEADRRDRFREQENRKHAEKLARKLMRDTKKKQRKPEPKRATTTTLNPPDRRFFDGSDSEAEPHRLKGTEYRMIPEKGRRTERDYYDGEAINLELAERLSHPLGRFAGKAPSIAKPTGGFKKAKYTGKRSLKTSTGYDSRTIARDILRAAGIHPTLPALNAQLNGRL